MHGFVFAALICNGIEHEQRPLRQRLTLMSISRIFSCDFCSSSPNRLKTCRHMQVCTQEGILLNGVDGTVSEVL